MPGNAAASVAQLQSKAVVQLDESDTPELDVALLLSHVLGKTRSWLYAWPEYVLNPHELGKFDELLQARRSGQPIAYLLGQRDFWKQSLIVNNAVLIPRPETELLVELALQLCPATTARVADLGTGSGAIALALAAERPHWQLSATDISLAALDVARSNAALLKLHNVAFMSGSWCEALGAGLFDMLVSNPPYIAQSDEHLLRGDVRFEPLNALVADADGLQDIALIAEQSCQHLKPGGYLLLEHGWQQGEAVRNLLAQNGYTAIRTEQDLVGHDRVTLGQRHE